VIEISNFSVATLWPSGLIPKVNPFRPWDTDIRAGITTINDFENRGGMANALKTLFNPPGWAPGDTSDTVVEMRRRAM
jgi:hypothetical protein